MSPRLPALIGAAALLAAPAVASADVRIQVPRSLLGGTVPAGHPAPPDAARSSAPSPPDGAPADTQDDGIDPSDPDFWELVWPVDVEPLPFPEDALADACPAGLADDCVLTGDEVGALPEPPAAAVANEAPPTPAASTAAAARHLSPPFAAWMVSQTPTLSWRPARGASSYNVQLLLGRHRVLSAWSRDNHLTVPPHAVDQGRYYVWAVWPAFGPPRRPTFGPPIGRSIFGVILRPRIVFRAIPGSHGRAVDGEVRPHIAGGLLSLRRPATAGRRAPARVRIDAAGHVRLRVSLREASRLRARLLDSGPRPPKGLRPR
jgi:hypothetical protein